MHWQISSWALEMMLSSAPGTCQHASMQQCGWGRSTPRARRSPLHAMSGMMVRPWLPQRHRAQHCHPEKLFKILDIANHIFFSLGISTGPKRMEHGIEVAAPWDLVHSDVVCMHAEEVEALARFAQEKLGRVDIWVNNAGISQAHKATLQHADADELRRVLDTNLLGSIFGARAALQVWTGCSETCMDRAFPRCAVLAIADVC